MKMFDFSKSSIGKKWIYVSILVSTDKDMVGVLKRKLLPYAEELNWEIKVERDKENIDTSNISLIPKERGDTNALSPLEFKEIKRKLLVFTTEIAEELGIKDLTQRLMVTITNVEIEDSNTEPVYHLFHRMGLLEIYYDIRDKIGFEQENKDLSKELFGGTVEDFIEDVFSKDKNTFKSETVKQWIEAVKKILKYEKFDICPKCKKVYSKGVHKRCPDCKVNLVEIERKNEI